MTGTCYKRATRGGAIKILVSSISDLFRADDSTF